MRKVHVFLREHSDLAYSESELYDELYKPGDARHSLSRAVEELTYLGGIDARRMQNVTYYRYWDELPELHL